MKRKILIIIDDILDKQILSDMLEEDYEIVTVDNEKDALHTIHMFYQEISAILIDFVIGSKVLESIDGNSSMSQIPIIAILKDSVESTEIKAQQAGVMDYITKPFCKEIILQRLNNMIHMVESVALINALQKDELTGIYNRKTFFGMASTMIQEHVADYYVMECLDIDKFKVINDRYGTDQGDEVLKYIASVIKNAMDVIGGICARIDADDFVLLYPFQDDDVRGKVQKEIDEKIKEYGKKFSSITINSGCYHVNDLTIPVSGMYDRALLALYSVKGDFEKRSATYDESMRTALLLEQEVTSEMQNALDSGQFEAWFQPQYNHATGAMVGAEVLVRWRHPAKGLVPPYIFIPIFERNGFIYELDKYIWEQACIFIRRWLDEDKEPLPISVNVSRYDALREDFFDTVMGLVNQYQIPPELFRMEITESAFAEASEQLIQVIKKLIAFGFVLEIDDFGSGYSSLNTLKDVPAQILKLDMKFFSKTDNADRSGNIVASIVRMAKWLDMAVIAEGVEEKEQADYLKSIGCYYIQGYYYAKPMMVSEYEALFTNSEKEQHMSRLQTLDTMDNNEFWNPKSMETLIFNSYVGGACIFEYHNGQMELLRTNERYATEMGNLMPDGDLINDMKPLPYLGEEDKRLLIENIENAIRTRRESSCELMLSGVKAHKTYVEYIRTTVRVIARTETLYLLYCVVVNTTERHLAEQERLKAEKKQLESAVHLQVIMESINGGVSAILINEDGTSKLVFTNDKYYGLYGYTREQAINEKLDIMMTLVPEDFPTVMEKVNKLKMDRKPVVIDYRIQKRDGRMANLRANASLMYMDEYGEVITSVVSDVTEIISLQDQLRAILQNINGGVTATVIKDGKPESIVVNNQFFEIHGYTTMEEFEAEYKDKYAAIYPEDRERVIRQFESNEAEGKYSIEYRIRRKDGEIRYIRNNISIVRLFGIDEPVKLSIIYDITQSKTAEEQLNFLNQSAHAILAQEDSEQAIHGTLDRILNYFDADRSYIVEFDYDRQVSNNTYEVCADGVESEIDNLQNIPFAISDYWFEPLSSAHYILIENVDELGDNNAQLRLMLLEQGIHSLVLASLFRDGNLIGFVGTDNPGSRANQIEQLTALADYLAILLTRRDTHFKIEQSHQAMQQLMPLIFDEMMRYSNDIAFVKDKDYHYLYCSGSYAKVLGLEDDDIIMGKTDYDFFEQGMADRIRESDKKLMTTGEPIIDRVEAIPSKNGMPFYTRVSKYLIRDERGNASAIYGVGRDVTKRREMNEQFEMLQNSIPGGLVTLVYSEGNSVMESCNRQFREWLGYREEEKITIDMLMSRVLEEDKADVQKCRELMIKNDTPIDCVFRCYDKNKDIMWVNLKASISDRVENTVIINAVLMDVTELQREKENLRRNEEIARLNYERELRLREEVFKNSISYYKINVTQKMIEEYHTINENWQGINSGDKIDEKLREKVLLGVVEEDRELVGNSLFSAALEEAYHNGQTTVSIVYRSNVAGDRIRWIKGTASIMERYQSGDIIALINNKDIDVKMKDQLAIKSIMDEEIESVAIVNVESGIAHFAQLNIESSDMVVDEDFVFSDKFALMINSVVVPEDQKKSHRFYDLKRLVAALQKESIIKHLFRVKLTDGTIRHKKVRAFYVDETHNVIALVERDITDLYEEEQRRHHELREAADAANKANLAKSEFLSRMSHDMRTPLNAILSFSDDDIIQSAVERDKEYLQKINFAGQYLAGIISDILDMSLIEQNKMVLKPEPYANYEFRKMINNIISEACKKKEIEFDMQIEEGERWIVTDKTRFNQIFINLLSNAVKFTPSGGHITFSSCSLPKSEDSLVHRRFIVSDNGIGMSKDFIPRAFSHFEQENRMRLSANNQGVGLGLPIVKKIIDLMQGTITVESEEGKGTTFIVDLPLILTEKPKDEVEPDTTIMQGMRVLMCEDNEINIEITKMLLEKKGCLVDCAQNGQMGLERFRQSPPDYYRVILMDIRMPVMNGYTATKEIRSLERADAKSIPIIALSADAFTEDIEVSKEVGMSAYIPKPIDEKLLYVTLCRFL